MSAIDIPVESQILEASEQAPLLSMFLRLDMPTVREVLSREDLREPETSVQSRGIVVGETTVGLLGACTRVIELLETPEDLPVNGSSARKLPGLCKTVTMAIPASIRSLKVVSGAARSMRKPAIVHASPARNGRKAAGRRQCQLQLHRSIRKVCQWLR